MITAKDTLCPKCERPGLKGRLTEDRKRILFRCPECRADGTMDARCDDCNKGSVYRTAGSRIEIRCPRCEEGRWMLVPGIGVDEMVDGDKFADERTI